MQFTNEEQTYSAVRSASDVSRGALENPPNSIHIVFTRSYNAGLGRHFMPNADPLEPDWLRQMENILETLNEGVVIQDDALCVVFTNEALLRLTGCERGELLGHTPEALFPPEDLPYLRQQYAIAQRNRHHRHEYDLPRKNGERVPVIFSGRLITGPDGRQYSVITLTDISAQKRMQEELRQANVLLEQRQKEIEADLALAARVQQSLAPASLVWGRVAVEAYYNPMHNVGGDFGLVLPHSDELLSLLVCDVSGHGIGSALVANRIYAETLHELERNTGPGGLLLRLHNFVREQIGLQGFYFTAAACRFDQSGRRLTFSSAGHPPTMLISGGRLRLLESRCAILGCVVDATPSESVEEIDLTPGDRLVLYTDGFIEVFNDHDEMLDIEGLEELVRKSAQKALPEMKQAILDGVARWRHGPLTDDMSLVLVELR
jgi:PAS domain S-box-containing protein